MYRWQFVLFCSAAFLCCGSPSISDHSDSEHNGNAEGEKTRSKQASEMLVPRYSTTALMCEPVFTGASGTAKWLRNGVTVATVTSSSNAILHNRTYHSDQPVPDVGFLIITNISISDEGEYWCRRDDTAQEGDLVRIVVAYVDQFPFETKPMFHPSIPNLGQRVVANCPPTRAVPTPSVSWMLNGEPIDMSSSRIEVSVNGTLLIRRFMPQDVGVYECIVSNFAGRTTAKIFIDAQRLSDGRFHELFDTSIFANACHSVFRSGLLWFLVGCLATSCIVLLYLMCAMVLIRPGSRNRITLRPGLFLRYHPSLAPGFRKVVAPTPDIYGANRS